MELLQKGDAILKTLLDESIHINNPLLHHPPIQAPLNELQCSICYNLFTIPIVLPNCKHMFCKKCLDEWISKSATTCPLCRIDLKSFQDLMTDEVKFSLIDYNTMFMINKMKVNCTREGCKWKGTLGSLETHLTTQCLLIKCPNQFCNSVMFEEDIKEHLETACQYRIIKCPQYCGEEIQANQIIEHMSRCLFSYSKCKQCEGIIQNSKLINHQCPQRNLQPCQNVNWGCKESNQLHKCQFEFITCRQCYQVIMRKDKQKHYQKCQKQSISFILNHFKELLINSILPIKQNNQLIEQAIQSCSQQSILITNFEMEMKTEDLTNILQQFGPIYNLIESMNIKEMTKQIAIRYYDQQWMQNCIQYMKDNQLINQKIEFHYLRTKKQLIETVLQAENLLTQDKNKLKQEFKQYQLIDAQLISNQTDWKKGKMTFTCLLFFPNPELAQECLKQNNKTMKPYSQIIQKPKYDLNPYNL